MNKKEMDCIHPLRFHSQMIPIPGGVFKHIQKVQRETTAYYGEDRGLSLMSSTVYQNPNENDDKVMGQYYAVKLLTSKLDRQDSLDLRKAIWEDFFNHSKAAQALKNRRK